MSVLSEELREQIRATFAKYPDKRAATLPALHIVHDAHRYVSTAAIEEIAELLELHPSEVADTMTFYNFFKDEEAHRLGKHRVWVCRSISCMLRGGEELLAGVSQRLGTKPGQTSADGRLTLEDPTTHRTVELEAFGQTNEEVFAGLLPGVGKAP